MTTPAEVPAWCQLLLEKVERLEAEAELRRLVSSYHRINDAGSASGTMPAWDDLSVAGADGTSGDLLREMQISGGAGWTGRGLSAAWPHEDGAALDDGTLRPEYMPRMLHMLMNEHIEVHGSTATGSWYCWEPAVVIVEDEPRAVFIVGRTNYEFTNDSGAWLVSSIEYEELFSTSVPGGGWVREPHVLYGPAQASGRAPSSSRNAL